MEKCHYGNRRRPNSNGDVESETDLQMQKRGTAMRGTAVLQVQARHGRLCSLINNGTRLFRVVAVQDGNGSGLEDIK